MTLLDRRAATPDTDRADAQLAALTARVPPTWRLPPPGVVRRHDGSDRVWPAARGSAVASTPALVDSPTMALPAVVVAVAALPGRHAAHEDTPGSCRPQALTQTQQIDTVAFHAELDQHESSVAFHAELDQHESSVAFHAELDRYYDSSGSSAANVGWLGELAGEYGVRLVVVDPLMANLDAFGPVTDQPPPSTVDTGGAARGRGPW